MNEQQTFEIRHAELDAALTDLVRVAAIRAPDSPALTTALLLRNSVNVSARAADPVQHRQAMSLLESCLSQVQAGKTELDLTAPKGQPTLAKLRTDLQRTLPRGPGQRG